MSKVKPDNRKFTLDLSKYDDLYTFMLQMTLNSFGNYAKHTNNVSNTAFNKAKDYKKLINKMLNHVKSKQKLIILNSYEIEEIAFAFSMYINYMSSTDLGYSRKECKVMADAYVYLIKIMVKDVEPDEAKSKLYSKSSFKQMYTNMVSTLEKANNCKINK